MRRLIRFFPLNKGIMKGDISSFVKTVGIYMISNMIFAMLVNVLDFIPLIKNLLHHMDNIYEFYIWTGTLLGGYQYFTGIDISQIEFVKMKDVFALWNNQKYKKYILIGAVILCFVPYSVKRTSPSRSDSLENALQQVADNKTQNENTELLAEESDLINSQETEINNSEIVESESEIDMETKTDSVAEVEIETLFNLEEALGEFLGEVEVEDATYKIYENGAELYELKAQDANVKEKVEYNGKDYPVIYWNAVYPKEVNGKSFEFEILETYEISAQFKYISYRAFTNAKTIVVPDTVEYIHIGLQDRLNSKIEGKYEAENIIFPKQLKASKWELPYGLFSDNLKKIEIPEGVVILNGTFKESKNLEEVVFPKSLKIIAGGAFYRCESLKNIVWADGLERIGNDVFNGCTSLTEINIPESVKYIDYCAFAHTGIRSLTIPANVNSFNHSAISGCNDIEELIIPNTVLEIGNNFSLESCSKLKKVVYPDNPKFDIIPVVGGLNRDLIIEDCPNLEEITLPNTIERLFLGNLSENCTIYAPEECIDRLREDYSNYTFIKK